MLLYLESLFTAVVLNWGQLCLCEDNWQSLETFLIVTNGPGEVFRPLSGGG